ncbi:hypothetical protein GGI15_004405 [Coemansia interrupta]|uniref:Peptidase S1 domain-containing protein n=1 Tax=Coemansia interrupta TaxID=1126814 RepID=A0A9W8LG35_9FUNG|nr:hypothetical protein GGI15_004405 [Coemansia interrupta]
MKIPFHALLLALGLVTQFLALSTEQPGASYVATIVSLDALHAGKKCMGALVTNTTVLTTADCLISSAHTRYASWLTTVSFNASQYRVRRTLLAPGFTPPSLRHNMGLLMLASPVPGSIAKPIRISPSWPPHAHVPGHSPLDVLGQAECHGAASYAQDSQVCAKGGVVCRGDEGLPVVGPGAHGEVLAGLVSYASGNPNAGAWCGAGERVYFEKAGAWADWVASAAGVRRLDVVAGEAEGRESSGSGTGHVAAQSAAAPSSNSSHNTLSSSTSRANSPLLPGRLHGLGALVIALAMIR